MVKLVDKIASISLPARVSESIYTTKRDLDVNYNKLDYEVHICTLNEEDYIESTLKSIVRQDPVARGDVPIVLIDSKSDDRTVEIAKSYVDEIILSDKGLLTARNKGINKRNPDVVLSADAADIYSRGWVNELAKPFEHDNIVAAYGNVYSKDPMHKRKQKLKHSVVNTWNLPGNNSAIRVSALREVGMFDESIDQQKLSHMVLEEQIFKKLELNVIGDIAYRPYASMYKSQRRKTVSRTTEKNSGYKKEIDNGERF